jgi:hypothetical protein
MEEFLPKKAETGPSIHDTPLKIREEKLKAA